MSKQLAELCTLLVEDIHGELPSRLFSTLIEHTRMTLEQIRFRTRLPARVIKNGLAVLIQHNLVTYFCADIRRPTYYQANTLQAYTILRAGKYLEIVYQRLGEDAATAYQWIQLLGHTSIDRLVDAEAKDVKDHNSALDKREAEEEARFANAAAGAAEKDEDDATERPKVNGAHHVNGEANGTHNEEANGMKAKSEVSKIKPRPRRKFAEEEKATLRKAITKLIANNYIEKFRFVNTLSDLDANTLIEEGVKAMDSTFHGILTPKNQSRFDAAFQKAKAQIFDHEHDLVNPFSEHWSTNEPLVSRTFGQRSKRVQDEIPEDEDVPRSGKRRKTGKNNHVESKEDAGEPVVSDIARPTITELERKRVKTSQEELFHTHHSKFNVAMRNDALLEMCQRRLGHSAAKVFAVILEMTESVLLECYRRFEIDPNTEDTYLFELPAVLTKEVASKLDHETLASLGPRPSLKEANKENVKKEKDRKKDGERGQEKDATAAEYKATEFVAPSIGEHAREKAVGRADAQQIHNVARQMDILAADPHAFITKTSHTNDRSSQAWKVDFHALVRKMIQFEIESMVQLRFGSEAAKILRILHSKGKLDEKQICNFGLVLPKVLRSKLSMMQDAGFIDAQEIPRDATRQPGRTIYLWFYDQDRCRQTIIDDAYKGMARLMQRARFERDNIRILLEKSQRSDVQGREEEYLTESERQALSEWNDKEEKIMVQLSRQDNIVTMFRDYLPLRTDKTVKPSKE